MDGVAQRTIKIVFLVEFIIGILGNGFIALVSCMDGVKRRKLSSVVQITIALAISRVSLLLLVTITLLFHFEHPGLLMSKEIMRTIVFSQTVTNHFNIWLATSLSIFYFLKVANFSNSIFHFLKWRVNEVVLVTLLVSLAPLSLNIVVTNMYVGCLVDGATSNKSFRSSWNDSAQLSKVMIFISSVFTLIPFIVSLTNFFLLIVSMWKHLRRVQHNAQGCSDARAKAHVRALKAMMLFLLLYIAFLLSLFVILSFELMDEVTIFLYEQITGIIFPTSHSYVLILADSKLRQASLKVLRWVRGKATWAQQFCP